MKSITEITSCRLCSGPITKVLDFGHTALANSYVRAENLGKPEFQSPLQVVLCQDCSCVQLKHTVDPKILFSDYLYESSTSAALRKHFEDYAKTTAEFFELKQGDFVVGIGGNDGVLEAEYQKLGFKVLNVEPAENIARKAVDINKVPTENSFFDVIVARHIENTFGPAKLITCNNCFAHIPDLAEVLAGVNELLADDGVFIFENAYLLDTIKGKYFDQVYAEHLFYHSVKPLFWFLMEHGFELFHVEQNKNQGGSIRCFAGKTNRVDPYTPKVAELIRAEEEAGLYRAETYTKFFAELGGIRDEINKIISQAKFRGETIACYGAPAKFTLFAKFMGLTKDVISYVVDDSPLKQGLFTPDSNIPIKDRRYFLENSPDLCLIMAWNFAGPIMAGNSEYRGKWLVPLPAPYIVA